jgi:DNA-directed RNA polymerase subunit beta'
MEKIINDENNKFNSVILMNKSGAVGALPQFTQMVGMRGLMLKSYNYNLAKNNKDSKIIKDTIESPVLSSFHEGLTISEYFNSAYGARKSMVDTALKTSKSGYMTRKLVDCAQDVIVREDDCGTKIGIIVSAITNDENQIIEKISERIIGRTSVNDIKVKNEVIVAANEIIDQAMAKKIENAGITSVEIFSPIKCNCKNGICKKCYGIDISTKKSIENNMPVGVIAAQSLGEPVTQLNMRAKATGGVAGGVQIAQGYERIKQLFDVVSPKEHELAQIAENNGIVTSIEIQDENNKVTIKYENDDIVTYAIPLFLKLLVGVDEKVIIGQKLSIGLISLKNMLNISGVDETRKYIINEVQKTYRSQGLEINDKYIEIIIKKMTDNMTVIDAGDSDDVYIGQNMKVSELLERNNKLLAKKQIPIAAKNEIYGLDLIPAKSASFLSAASFQYTKKILINAALSSQIDELMSLKENVMMGKLIPVGTGINTTKEEIIANGKKALESEY